MFTNALILYLATLLSPTVSRLKEEKFSFSDDDYDSLGSADTPLVTSPWPSVTPADLGDLDYKVGSHFHLDLGEGGHHTSSTAAPTTKGDLPELPPWHTQDGPVEPFNLAKSSAESPVLFDVDTGDDNWDLPATSTHVKTSKASTSTTSNAPMSPVTTTTTTTTTARVTPASLASGTLSSTIDMVCHDGYEARGLWVLMNDPTRGYTKGKHESVAAVSLICDGDLDQLNHSPATPKASNQQQWTRLACMDRQDGQRVVAAASRELNANSIQVVMSAISTAAESEAASSPLMELRLQCSDGITVYGYAPTESRRMWREGQPCNEGETAKGIRYSAKNGILESIATECAPACTRRDCGVQELRGSTGTDRPSSVCGWKPNCHCECGANPFVARPQTLSSIPLPNAVAEPMGDTLFPPPPSLMSQQIQQQTEVAQQANLQAIDEQRISQIEREENRLDATLGQMTGTLDVSKKNLTSVKDTLTVGFRQNAKALLSLVEDLAALMGKVIPPSADKDDDPMVILSRAEEMLRQQITSANGTASIPAITEEERKKVTALSDAVSNIIRAETLNRNRIDQLSKAFESLHSELSEGGQLKGNHSVTYDPDYLSLLSADLNSVQEGMDEDISGLHHISETQARSMQALRSSLRALSQKVDSMAVKEAKDTAESMNIEASDAKGVDDELAARIEDLEAKVRFLQNPTNQYVFSPQDRIESLVRVSEVQEHKIGLIEKEIRTMVEKTSPNTIRAHVDDALEESKKIDSSTALFTPPGYLAIIALMFALGAIGMGYVGTERADKQLQDITYLNEQVSEIIQRIWPEGEEEDYYGEDVADYTEDGQEATEGEGGIQVSTE